MIEIIITTIMTTSTMKGTAEVDNLTDPSRLKLSANYHTVYDRKNFQKINLMQFR